MKAIENIFKIMSERGITAANLTKDVPLANGVVTQWKQGKAKPSLETLIKLARYFNISADYLLGLSDNPISQNQDIPYVSSNELAFLEKYRSLSLDKRNLLESLLETML